MKLWKPYVYFPDYAHACKYMANKYQHVIKIRKCSKAPINEITKWQKHYRNANSMLATPQRQRDIKCMCKHVTMGLGNFPAHENKG